MRDDPDSFYSGTLANDILCDIKKFNGSVTQIDLRSYSSITRVPYKGNIQNMTMYLTPPPKGGAVLALILNILRRRSCLQNDYLTFLERKLSASIWKVPLLRALCNLQITDYIYCLLNELKTCYHPASALRLSETSEGDLTFAGVERGTNRYKNIKKQF